jgi:hypothetical protein
MVSRLGTIALSGTILESSQCWWVESLADVPDGDVASTLVRRGDWPDGLASCALSKGVQDEGARTRYRPTSEME